MMSVYSDDLLAVITYELLCVAAVLAYCRYWRLCAYISHASVLLI